MSDEWMPSLRLKLTRAEFEQLPRHPAYKYEWMGAEACLSPWPKYFHAQLDLLRIQASDSSGAAAQLREIESGDCAQFVSIFQEAFGRLQPYGSLPDEKAKHAAEECLTRTFAGKDGPLVDAASFVAVENEIIEGALLITLIPGGNPLEYESFAWSEPPPAHLWERGEGQPHLTWIFVRHSRQGSGVGTQLLRKSAAVLLARGYKSLWTTFMLGNDSSMLWHWRNGFELLPHSRSKRQHAACGVAPFMKEPS